MDQQTKIICLFIVGMIVVLVFFMGPNREE